MKYMRAYSSVADVLEETLGVDRDEIRLEANLVRDLGAESIDYLDITFRLEKKFDIKIPKGELFPELADERYYKKCSKKNNRVYGGIVTRVSGINLNGKRHLIANFPYLGVREDLEYDSMDDVHTVGSVVRYIESRLKSE